MITQKMRDEAIIVLRAKVPAFAEKVAPIYRLLNWRWRDGVRPPSAAEICETLYGLIDSLKDDEVFSSSTGGLMAWIEDANEDTGCPEAGLLFSLGKEVYYGSGGWA